VDAGELARASIGSIRAHKLRSFLTLLGIIIGVTTIVLVASVITGLNAFVAQKIIRLAPDTFVITKYGIIRSREEFVDALKRPDLGDREFETLQRTLSKAETIAAQVGTGGLVKYRDRSLADVRIQGCTSNLAPLVGVELAEGRFFSEAEEQSGAAVAVIGWDVKDELYGVLDPVGREVLVAGLPHRVIGVIEQQGKILGQSQDQQVFLPLRAWRKLYGSRSTVDIVVRARGGVEGLEGAMDEARAILRALRHVAFKDADPFGIVTVESLQTLWRQISAAAFILTLLVSGVSLGVGGIVIMNIMLVGVVERTREIGVRLAVGARKRDIRRQFLLEAAFLSSGGGLVGLVAGALGAAALRDLLGFPARTTAVIALGAVALSAAVGIMAGYWPARSASNLPVVDALRDEP